MPARVRFLGSVRSRIAKTLLNADVTYAKFPRSVMRLTGPSCASSKTLAMVRLPICDADNHDTATDGS